MVGFSLEWIWSSCMHLCMLGSRLVFIHTYIYVFVALKGRLALGVVVVKRWSSESYLDFIIYVIGECFVVKPSDSETQRRIGARGSICFLHISRWGISLALQVKHLFFTWYSWEKYTIVILLVSSALVMPLKPSDLTICCHWLLSVLHLSPGTNLTQAMWES